MAKIMNGQTNPLILHPQRLIDLKQQHRDQGSLPVVAMNDLRPLAGLQHELQRRLAEKREPCRVVIRAIEMPAPEEMVLRMRLDEALAAIDPAEPHGAMNGSAEPRHPQIGV